MQQQNQIKRYWDRHQSRERESFKEWRNDDLEHKALLNDDLQSKKTKCFSNCCSRKVVYILTERAPESLALREEISTPESLESGESEHQRVVSVQERRA